MLAEIHKYVARTKEKLKQLPKSSKAWWKLIKNLQNKAEKNSSVPALKREDGPWAQEALEKAELLQRTFSKKYTLPPECVPEVQTWVDTNEGVLGDFLPVRVRDAVKVLKKVKHNMKHHTAFFAEKAHAFSVDMRCSSGGRVGG